MKLDILTLDLKQWNATDWGLLWSLFGAIGQWLAGAATVWAVLVALNSSRREREQFERAIMLKHLDVAPQLLVTGCYISERVLESDPWGTPTKTDRRLMVIHIKNLGAGGGLSLRVDVVPTSGSLAAETRFFREHSHIPVNDQVKSDFYWEQDNPNAHGVIRLVYYGLYGARYSREYNFELKSGSAEGVVSLRPDADTAEYPSIQPVQGKH